MSLAQCARSRASFRQMIIRMMKSPLPSASLASMYVCSDRSRESSELLAELKNALGLRQCQNKPSIRSSKRFSLFFKVVSFRVLSDWHDSSLLRVSEFAL
jgi:hypothetical protein